MRKISIVCFSLSVCLSLSDLMANGEDTKPAQSPCLISFAQKTEALIPQLTNATGWRYEDLDDVAGHKAGEAIHFESGAAKYTLRHTFPRDTGWPWWLAPGRFLIEQSEEGVRIYPSSEEEPFNQAWHQITGVGLPALGTAIGETVHGQVDKASNPSLKILPSLDMWHLYFAIGDTYHLLGFEGSEGNEEYFISTLAPPNEEKIIQKWQHYVKQRIDRGIEGNSALCPKLPAYEIFRPKHIRFCWDEVQYNSRRFPLNPAQFEQLKTALLNRFQKDIIPSINIQEGFETSEISRSITSQILKIGAQRGFQFDKTEDTEKMTAVWEEGRNGSNIPLPRNGIAVAFSIFC